MVVSIGVTCRSKIAKIITIGNQRGPPRLPYLNHCHIENVFSTSLERKKPTDSKLGRTFKADVDQIQLQYFRSEIQERHHRNRLVNLFGHSPKPNDKLTQDCQTYLVIS